MIHWKREAQLRSAVGIEEGAEDALADFYEDNGQPSRAALWRNKERREHMLWSMAPDHLQLRSKQSKADPRRNAMMWVLRQLHDHAEQCLVRFSSYPALGAGFGISGQMIRHHVMKQDNMIGYAAAMETAVPTMAATQRLAAAGALRGGDLHLYEIEIPPHDWPLTHRLKARPAEDRWKLRNKTNATSQPSPAANADGAASPHRASRGAKDAGS